MHIRFEKVSYSPGRVNIEAAENLDRLSFELEGAGFTGIVGGAGSGKCSVLYLLSGLLRPERGQIFVDGEDINGKNYRRGQKKVSCAFVARNADMAFYEKTVERELEIVLRPASYDADEKKRLMSQALKRAGLDFEAVSQIAPASMSRSLRYKLSLASALLTKPDILLLDEPFTQLDASGRKMFTELVLSLKEEGCRVIAATNDVDFLAEHADHVLLMQRGRLIRSGTPRHIFNDCYDLLRNRIPVPKVKKITQKLWEKDVNIPANVVEYEQLTDRLKIIMWRKSR